MKTKRIVITGGPGTGKTALIEYLIQQHHECLPEISRTVTKKAQEEGIDQLFLARPLLFSELLLEGRLRQFLEAEKATVPQLFYDRGMPDVTAYMDYLDIDYPETFNETCNKHRYDAVFLLPPWEEIYIQDNERYESFEQAELIFEFLLKGYENYGYSVIQVPLGTLEERTLFILQTLEELF